ncbi:MAG: XdhC family protein [Candidatus Izemoplasmataceae bacterium]
MNPIYEKIAQYQKEGIGAVVVTVTEKQGAGPVEVGKKMVVNEKGEAHGTVGGGALEHYAREKCKTLLKTKETFRERYVLDEGKVTPNAKTLPMVCGGVVTLFYEYVGTKNHVYLFGAGHVSKALAYILKTMDFHLTVIDERKEVLDQFPYGDRLVHSPFAAFIDDEGVKDGSFIIVCTPNHKHDYHVINKVIEHGIKPQYMGMLCSPEKLNDYLEKTYETYGKGIDLSHFYSPIGLDTGGGSPEEIAVSIAAEMLAIVHGKKGHKHMRETMHGRYRYWDHQ